MGKTSAYPKLRLVFYWYELPAEPDLRSDRHWGELLGAVHALWPIAAEFRAASRTRNLRRALTKLESSMRNYMARAYELRERVLLLLRSMTPVSKSAIAKLKDPKTRASAALPMVDRLPQDMPIVLKILETLDADIHLRNQDTHNAFLQLGLDLGNGPEDPDGLLMELEMRPNRRIEKALRKAIGIFAAGIALRIAIVRIEAMKLLDRHDPWTYRSRK